MKRIYPYIFAAMLSLIAISCTRIENGKSDLNMENMVFNAVIEDDGMTKTMLDGEIIDDKKYTLWLPGDKIGIATYGNRYYEFTNIATDTTRIGVFEGSIGSSNTYYAIYPYQNINMSNILTVNLPSKQRYIPNSFGNEASLMVAKGGDNQILKFRNLCGVFALSLTGNETIQSITLTVNELNISGQGTVKFDYVDQPVLIMAEDETASRSVTLDCGDGIQLDPTTPTLFHIVIPDEIYEGFRVLITTTDGKYMEKSTDKTLTITRANITTASALVFDENISDFTDLSLRGTSNCYIVSEEGRYSFDATKAGDGSVDSLSISPVRAQLLWEDKEGVISNVAFNAETQNVRFLSSGIEGNALIAVMGADSSILWSWHIWATETPSEQILNSYTILDRHLGASSNNESDGRTGLLYQWGRKDPFCISPKTFSSENISATLEQSVQKPTIFFSGNNWPPEGDNLWSSSRKSIYDPCPMGWKVASEQVWINTRITSYDNYGSYITDNQDNQSKHSYASRLDNWSNISSNNDQSGEIWTSTKGLTWYYNNGSIYQNTRSSNDAYPIRCMKDEDYVDAALPALTITHFTDVTSNSLMVNFTTTSIGASEITEMGIVYSTEENPTLENGTKITHPNNVTGDYDVSITNLTSSTIYYIRAYGINSYGTGYSNVRKVLVPNGDGAQVLSIEGTANSYIASPLYRTFSFEALYKGNSTESIGSPATAEVIWETKNTTESVSQGDIIRDVVYDNGIISFNLSDEGTEGNAIIAAKDGEGNILWSWHIWVTDFDAEETACTFPSGAVMMDRNLGALNNSTDVLSFGLLYQWGRKDPFAGSGDGTNNTFATTYPANAISFVNGSDGRNSLAYATSHPNHNILASTWNYTNQGITWWGETKTMYDPCPPGWQIPPVTAWNNYTSTTSSFPLTGGINEGANTLTNVGNNSIPWSYTVRDYEWMRCFKIYNNGASWTTIDNSEADVSCGRPVRCQKIQ